MQNGLTFQDQPSPQPILLFPPGEPVGDADQQAVPLGRLTSIIRRHFWVIVLTVAVGAGGTAAIVLRMPKQYTAEALILIEPQRTQVSDLQAISPDAGGDTSSLVRTQIDILRSPALASGMVESLNLTRYAEFNPPSQGRLAQAEKFLKNAVFGPSDGAHELTQEEEVQAAAAVLSSKISFGNEQHSSVLRVSVTTQDPELSAKIANQFAKLFLDFKRQEKFDAMQRAHDWFQEQMGPLADQLRDADLAVERYRQENRLDEQSSDEGPAARMPTINRQQLDATSRQLVEVSRERSRKESQYAQAQAVIRGDAPASALPEVLASPLITQLAAQAATVAGREAQLASTQGSQNPVLASTHAQLQELHARIDREMTNIAQSLNVDAKASRAQEQAVRQQMEQLRVAVSAENSAQVGLQALQTKARATRSIYESFLTRATQLANVAGIQEPDASLVSSARTPLGPSGPQTLRLIAVAGGGSLALGVVLACLIERLRRGFSLPEHLESTLGITLATLVPSVRRATLRGKGRSTGRMGLAYKTSFDKLRGQMRALGDAQPKVVMVTSSLPKEGKSVFAAGLARNAAAAGWRVLLIDCDIASPAITKQFGLPPGPGLCEILSQKSAAQAGAAVTERPLDALFGDSEALLHEPEPRLRVIKAGHTPGDPQELLASARMRALLAVFRERFDLVVLDTPPVLPVADALVLARLADATLIVVRWEKTARAAAQEAVRLLHQSRARLMGAVMTRVDLRTAAGSAGRMSYAFSGYDAHYRKRPRPVFERIAADRPFR